MGKMSEWIEALMPDDVTEEQLRAGGCVLFFTVICTGCGEEIGPSMDADALQAIAEERGWRVVRGNVYCKDCADALLGGETDGE
jgi:hypothetical protein